MMIPPAHSLSFIRGLMQSIDDRIENVIDAHGFSFSALAVDHIGAKIQFQRLADDPAASWHLTITQPALGRSVLSLQRGEESAPSLALTVDGALMGGLAGGLAVALELIAKTGL